MPFKDVGALRFYQFESLTSQAISHAIFTRRGGVSEGPYAELNVGATVGDEREHVNKNLELAFAAVDRPRDSLFDSWLVHGTHALIADDPRPPEWEKPPQADIVLTNKPHVTLFMRYADCVPIIYLDPVNKAVGLTHAGWRGTVQGVALKAIEAMELEYGTRPKNLVVGIGPAISAPRYEVGQEVVAEVETAYGHDAAKLLRHQNGSVHFDLVAANRLTLEEAGVRQIEMANLCTASNTEDWFSYRASDGKTGRFGAMIALNS